MGADLRNLEDFVNLYPLSILRSLAQKFVAHSIVQIKTPIKK